MFERYTEKARRVVFFARYEASQFGTPSIETEHLLLGILREDKSLANRFLPSIAALASIRTQIGNLTTSREKISTSVDLPLSHESKRALAYAAEEAERLRHKFIGPEHLLLGLLREEKCLAADLLRERGVSIERVREELAARRVDSSDSPGPRLQVKLLAYLESLPNELSVVATGLGLNVGVDPLSGPFLYIEVLSPTVRLSDLQRGADLHFGMGIRYLWLFDPGARRVYVVTPEAGLREFKGDVLRTESPALELPVAEVFE